MNVDLGCALHDCNSTPIAIANTPRPVLLQSDNIDSIQNHDEIRLPEAAEAGVVFASVPGTRRVRRRACRTCGIPNTAASIR